jgi:hypothetical protein
MYNNFIVDEPKKVTVTLQKEGKPGFFSVFNKDKKETEYFRLTAPGQNILSFNITRPGTYQTNKIFSEVKFEPITPVNININLPEPQKEIRAKTFKIVYNPKLTGTPARNYYNKGVIEYSTEFKKLPYQIRLFILCHEVGHFYYHDEILADTFAAKLFLKNGGNLTSAYYALKYVLKEKNPVNQNRINQIFKTLSNGKK